MYTSLRLRAVRGFTLIELLIVVIIIAILAAIAIPQFSNSSGDAQEAALDANLATMRSSIEMYRVQHANIYPGVNISSGGAASCTASGGAVGTGAVKTALAFTDQLTAYSNAAGGTCTVKNTDYPYGPYVRAIPAEPIKNVATITVIDGIMSDPALDGSGWRYSLTTGAFAMNSLTKDRGAVKTYFAH